MRHTVETKEKAFQLHSEGKSYREIMAELGVGSIKTIWRWSVKFKWAERGNEIAQQVKQNLDTGSAEKITKMLERHYSVSAKLEAGVGRALQVILGKDIAELKKSTPDPLALARIGKALKDAVSLQRQARGLPADGLSEADSLGEYTNEELKLIYEEAIRRSKEGDGESD